VHGHDLNTKLFGYSPRDPFFKKETSIYQIDKHGVPFSKINKRFSIKMYPKP
jgi:hypothetical protein